MPSLHQRTLQTSLSDPYPLSPRYSSNSQRQISIFSRTGLVILFCLMLILGVFMPWTGMPQGIFSVTKPSVSKWRHYTLAEAVSFVAKNGTVIVCAVSHPYLPFLNNWLISIARQKHQDEVLVIAEDYATLYKVNEKWPGHAVLVPPAPDSQTAHKFGSQGFFNFTSRRPRHLLHILELGYNVMYNDVDMVWLGDPFPYLQGNHDVYFTDDMAAALDLQYVENYVVTLNQLFVSTHLVLSFCQAPASKTSGY
uniref:Nucleotide-diphospho-sugar transferase domain-containing protein n=1 Tax=Manihot esculenta TaxID=3983 RepID=A0A2C9VU63_MANES